MATTWNHAPAAARVSATATTGNRFGLIGRILGAIENYRTRIATLNELHSLDARDLADLRISPYDFDDISRGTYRR